MVLDPGSMSGNDCYLILKSINILLKLSSFWCMQVKILRKGGSGRRRDEEVINFIIDNYYNGIITSI